MMDDVIEPRSASRPGGLGLAGKAFRENLTPTQHGVTAKPARYDQEFDAPSRERQVENAPMIATVNAARDGIMDRRHHDEAAGHQ
jgi:hypothetical protein